MPLWQWTPHQGSLAQTGWWPVVHPYLVFVFCIMWVHWHIQSCHSHPQSKFNPATQGCCFSSLPRLAFWKIQVDKIRVNWCQFDTALFDFTKYMQGSLSSSSSSTAFNLHYSYLEGVPSMVAVCLWCLYKLQTPSLGIDGFNLSNSPAKSLPAKAARPWEALHWKH